MNVLRVDPAHPEAALLAQAAAWLHHGGIVVMPTDTLYGLAVDPGSASAVAALFDAKGRDERAALPLVAASAAQIAESGARMNLAAERLGARCWPGPLSLILDAPDTMCDAVHGGTRTIAVRVPAHPVTRALCDAFGGLLTATSANRSGSSPAASVAALDRIASDPRVLVIDGGSVPGGAPSTIIDMRGGAPVLVRAGAIAWDRVLELLHA